MRWKALTVLGAVVVALAGAPAAHAGGGCTGVSVKGPKTVPEAAGVAQFTISADELPVVEPPPPDLPPPPPPPPPGFSRPFQACFVTVDYATADGTAQAGRDYAPVGGSVDLDPGQSATVEVPIIDDATDEPDEAFSLQTSEGSAAATIVDDDAAPTLSVSPSPVAEGARAEVFTIALSAPSAFPVTAAYSTADGSAVAGADYVPMAGTVTFAPGTTRQTVSVPLVDDRVREGDETFTLVLSAPQNAAIGAPGAAAIVHDDDAQTGLTGPSGPTGPTRVPSLDTTPPKITVPPGQQVGSTLVFTIGCPASEGLCTGRVRLDLLASGSRARAAKGTAAASLGSTLYRIRGGEKKKVKVELNARGKKLLKKRKKLRVKATFRTKDSAGNVSTTSQRLTVHAAAFRHS